MPHMPMVGRVWSVHEANQTLPRVEEMLAECRAILVQLRAVRDHLQDLKIVHGEAVHDPSCPDHGEHRLLLHRFRETRLRLEEALQRFADQEILVKDLDAGIVDFPTLLGEETVLLCYRSGEEQITHWHTRGGGFADRRPLPDLRDAEATGRA